MDLERARKREHDLRVETEAFLDGLRALTMAEDTDALFRALVGTLKTLVEIDDAFEQ